MGLRGIVLELIRVTRQQAWSVEEEHCTRTSRLLLPMSTGFCSLSNSDTRGLSMSPGRSTVILASLCLKQVHHQDERGDSSRNTAGADVQQSTS